MKFRRAQLGKVRDSPAGSLVETLTVDIAQFDPCLCCSLTAVGHHKCAAALSCHCRVFLYLDHQTTSKGAPAYHHVGHSQDGYSNEYCNHPLQRVLPDH